MTTISIMERATYFSCLNSHYKLAYLYTVIPLRYVVNGSQLATSNGSSHFGFCNDTTRASCKNPASSALFDGVIPILTELDGHNWARQLLTMKYSKSNVFVNFDIGGYALVDRVEITLFNCPRWGIAASTIRLYVPNNIMTPSFSQMKLNEVTNIHSSCDSLVKVCMTCLNCNKSALGLLFHSADGSEWVHIAEVTFHTDNTFIPCPIITTPPADITMVTSPPPRSTVATPPTSPTTASRGFTAEETHNKPGTTSATLPTKIDISLQDKTNNETTVTSNSIPIAVSVVHLFLLAVLVGVVISILTYVWRCRHAKNCKNDLTPHAAGKGTQASHQPHPLVAVSLYEEIGQAAYNKDQEAKLDSLPPPSSEQLYAQINEKTCNEKTVYQQPAETQFYAQINEKTCNETSIYQQPAATQLYAQINEKTQNDATVHQQTAATQLYVQINEKTCNETTVYQHCGQTEKRKKQRKDLVKESDAVYFARHPLTVTQICMDS